MSDRNEMLIKAAEGLKALAILLEEEATAGENEDQMDLPGFSEEKVPVTFEQVQKALIEKSRNGYRQVIQALLSKHGATKLSDIKDEYELRLLLEDAEEYCRDITKQEIVEAAESVIAHKSEGYLSELLDYFYVKTIDELPKSSYASFLWEARRVR